MGNINKFLILSLTDISMLLLPSRTGNDSYTQKVKESLGSDYKVSNIGEVGRILGDSDGENTELVLLVYTKMYKKMLTKRYPKANVWVYADQIKEISKD